MDVRRLSPVERIVKFVKNGEHFILQGGAGSGKTESLKQVVQTLLEIDPTLKIACITHTNKAADEIQDRIQAKITVSTIHSFLASLIKPYARNIKTVFPNLFLLPSFEAFGLEHYGNDEKLYKKGEHDRFKKLYEKLTARRKIVLSIPTDKVTGKREYDKNPSSNNAGLNSLIDEVNTAIRDLIAVKKVHDFVYNETRFNNFHSSTYGHDGLLEIAAQLFDKYPILGRIIADRYDCVFIDEYQDANADIVRVLLNTPPVKQIVIGLFGDSEQAIYEEGIGSAQKHIDSKKLVLVEKKDNYRCSPPVIRLANQFRTDGLTQEIALKELEGGILEPAEDREGSAAFHYAFAPAFEDTGEEKVDKENHKHACAKARDVLVEKVSQKHLNYIQLKLTNKSIARDVGFEGLYEIFSNRYNEPRDRIKRTLERLQFGEVSELICLFQSVSGNKRAYNRLISKLQRRNFTIRAVEDKEVLEKLLSSLCSNTLGAYKTVQYAIKQKLIEESDSHKVFRERATILLEKLKIDDAFIEFERLHSTGANTLLRMKKALPHKDVKLLNGLVLEERFEEMERNLKDKRFFEALFSPALPFSEVTSFYDYEDEGNSSRYSTMHKTKGTGIDDVIVVLHEYGWVQKYNFESCFTGQTPETPKEISTRKLLYVACSRTKRNLICVRLVRDHAEAEKIKTFFPQSELINLN